ncbi:MAG: LysR family transcriptional regulator [Janthinobacterium lividum]
MADQHLVAPVDLARLRTVVAVTECGGQERAAAALHLGQPTVRQHVKLLERRLRQTLTRRHGRRTELTVDGERLLVEARRILVVHDESVERLAASALPTVVIGSTETAAGLVLPGLLAVLRDAYPTTSVTFRIDRSTPAGRGGRTGRDRPRRAAGRGCGPLRARRGDPPARPRRDRGVPGPRAAASTSTWRRRGCRRSRSSSPGSVSRSGTPPAPRCPSTAEHTHRRPRWPLHASSLELSRPRS